MAKSSSTPRADGRLCKTIVDPRTHKRVYFYGKTEREINKKIMLYSQKAEHGRAFSEIADEWWGETEPKLALQSLRSYKLAMSRAVTFFNDTAAKNITAKDIQKYLTTLAKQGYSQKVVSNHRMVVNRILSYAVTEGDIELNPCASVKTPTDLPKTTREAAKHTDEQIIKDNIDLWLFPFFALMTGMRKGEILALKWKDIDFEKNYIYVTKSVAHDGDKPVIKTPKTEASNRIVPLLAPLRTELLKRIGKPDEYIISDDGKTPLTNRRYITLYDRYREITGITATAHQLRHSFATIAFEADLDPKSVQEILGHKQLSTTMDIYTQFREKKLAAAADLLNKTLDSN
jgi:integrase